MAITFYPTKPLSAYERMQFITQGASRGSIVIVGDYYTYNNNPYETAHSIYVGSTGNLILEGIDGIANYWASVPASTVIYYKHRRVLSSATVNGNSVTTSASNLTWMGGCQ